MSTGRGYPVALRPALRIPEGSLLPPWTVLEPLGALGEAAAPDRWSLLCLAGTHRSTSGTACSTDDSARTPFWASGLSESESESESSLLLLLSPLLELLSPLLELHRGWPGGGRRLLP